MCLLVRTIIQSIADTFALCCRVFLLVSWIALITARYWSSLLYRFAHISTCRVHAPLLNTEFVRYLLCMLQGPRWTCARHLLASPMAAFSHLAEHIWLPKLRPLILGKQGLLNVCCLYLLTHQMQLNRGLTAESYVSKNYPVWDLQLKVSAWRSPMHKTSWFQRSIMFGLSSVL